MTLGFRTRTKEEFIEETLKNHHSFKRKGGVRNFVEYQRKSYKEQHASFRFGKFRKQELFEPFPYDAIDYGNQGDTRMTLKGWWMVIRTYDDTKDDFTFTIKVKVGEHTLFYPKFIRENIIKLFDENTYDAWKQTVLDDINSLRWCVSNFDKGSDYLWSDCVSPSAERLCKSVGLTVKQGIAFI